MLMLKIGSEFEKMKEIKGKRSYPKKIKLFVATTALSLTTLFTACGNRSPEAVNERLFTPNTSKENETNSQNPKTENNGSPIAGTVQENEDNSPIAGTVNPNQQKEYTNLYDYLEDNNNANSDIKRFEDFIRAYKGGEIENLVKEETNKDGQICYVLNPEVFNQDTLEEVIDTLKGIIEYEVYKVLNENYFLPEKLTEDNIIIDVEKGKVLVKNLNNPNLPALELKLDNELNEVLSALQKLTSTIVTSEYPTKESVIDSVENNIIKSYSEIIEHIIKGVFVIGNSGEISYKGDVTNVIPSKTTTLPEIDELFKGKYSICENINSLSEDKQALASNYIKDLETIENIIEQISKGEITYSDLVIESEYGEKGVTDAYPNWEYFGYSYPSIKAIQEFFNDIVKQSVVEQSGDLFKKYGLTKDDIEVKMPEGIIIIKGKPDVLSEETPEVKLNIDFSAIPELNKIVNNLFATISFDEEGSVVWKDKATCEGDVKSFLEGCTGLAQFYCDFNEIPLKGPVEASKEKATQEAKEADLNLKIAHISEYEEEIEI